MKAFTPLGRDGCRNIAGCWNFSREIYDYGELIRIEAISLSEEESRKVVELGRKKHNCEIVKEERPLLFGGKTTAVIVKLKEESENV